MKPGRLVALVAGCLLVIPGIGLLVGGGGLALAYALGRGDDGYFNATLDRVESSTVAVTTGDIEFSADPGSPDWLLDTIDADVRLRVTNAAADRDVFVGVGPEADVDAYLAGVAHDEITGLDGNTPAYRTRSGSDDIAPPTEQTFWAESASGPGTEQLDWSFTSGRWVAVVMNADASPGVAADVEVGAKAGFVLPLALILLGLGAVITAGSVALIAVGATGASQARHPEPATVTTAPGAVLAATTPVSPVSLYATLDPQLSRWQWLVKWLLAIPHFIVLVFLWVAFVVLSVVAGFAILFTGRYPRSLFDFNAGVLRWSWRVSFYAGTGGIGTDRYPPFSLAPDPSYPAGFDIVYPEQLSRRLVLVKWWLLAIPHYLIVGLLAGGSVAWTSTGGNGTRFEPVGGGLLGLLVLVAGAALLFGGRYPQALFDLIVGLNRWIFRVVAYAALMTDRYPPFRLDQGGTEPPAPQPPQGPPPAPTALDLRADEPATQRVSP